MLTADIQNLRNSPLRERMVYAAMVLFIGYLSTDYLLKAELPDLHTFADFFLTEPAKLIVQFLKVQPT